MSSSLVSSEKLTDYTVTLESNLAHYQKEPDSYSWKNKWITWAPVAQGIQEQNQVDHLGPHGPKGFKSQSQVDHLGPSGPRDPRAKPGGSLGPPWAQGIQEPKNPSPCSSNIGEPDYLRHWYSGWGNSGSLMLLLQGRAETKTLNFFARRMGKNHRKDGDPCPAQKKSFSFKLFFLFVLFFFLFLASTHTDMHTHTDTDTQTQTQTHTHTHKSLSAQ